MRKSISRSRVRLLYAGISAGAIGASLFIGAPAAFAAPLTAMTPSAGTIGTVIKVQTASGTAFDTGAPAAFFTTGFATGTTTCPTYTTTITGQTVVPATGATKIDSDKASFTVPNTVTAGTGGAPKDWKLCVYNATAANTAALNDGATFTSVPPAGINPANGPSGGGNMVTFSVPTASAVFTTTPGVVFDENNCSATYGSPTTKAATATRVSNTQVTAVVPTGVIATGPNTGFTACFYTGTQVGSTLIAATNVAYNAGLPPVTLSSGVGAYAGTNGVTVDSPNDFLLGVTTPAAQFNAAEKCPTTYATAAGYTIVNPSAGKVRKVANNRLALTVPALAASPPATPVPFQVCIYRGSTVGTSPLIAAAPYTAAVVHSLTAVMPASGTALGGTVITVTGSGFPTTPGTINATLGGLPLMDIMPVNETTFTARTPMHSVERNVALVVSTPVGTKSLAAAYSYLNGIAIAPNFASTDMKDVTVAVKGVGFLSTTFNGATSDAHVYLVRGAYNPANDGSGKKLNGPMSECNDVLPINDNELICTLRLDQRLSAAGTITPEIAVGRSVTDIDTTNNSRLISSATAAFTGDDIGKSLTQTNGTAAIPDDTTIVDVLSATQAIISKQATATVATSVTARIGAAAVRTVASVAINNATSLTASASSFTSADIGRVVTGTGIPTGATITAVDGTGGIATISAATTGGSQTVTVSLYNALPVPAGAYTLTFVTNGTMGVDTTAATYSQSTVSGSSSFTVASS